jgi:hypothetical protein
VHGDTVENTVWPDGGGDTSIGGGLEIAAASIVADALDEP